MLFIITNLHSMPIAYTSYGPAAIMILMVVIFQSIRKFLPQPLRSKNYNSVEKRLSVIVFYSFQLKGMAS